MIQVVNPLEHPTWDEMLLASSDGSFFHSSSWARVLSESYDYTPLYFTAVDNGRIHALVPIMEVNSILTGRRGVSLPFTDFCRPIIGEAILFQELLDNIIAHGKYKGWKHIELRGYQDFLPDSLASATYLRHTLDLTKGTDQIFRALRKGTKSAIKKAEKEDIEIEISSSERAVMEFYDLNCITRRSHGLPPQPKNFFNNVYRYVLSEGLGIVVLATYRGGRIAGSVFFNFGDKVIYKYGASRREYQDLRANNLVLWNAIKHYSEKGCTEMCFGRTEMENEGLRIFKNGWGTREETVSYYKYDLSQERYVANKEGVSKLQNMIFGKMPIPLLKLIGTISYKHMG